MSETSAAQNKDQSMEEILQSIRRIIAEENDNPEAQQVAEDEDVLELTEVVQEDDATMATDKPAEEAVEIEGEEAKAAPAEPAADKASGDILNDIDAAIAGPAEDEPAKEEKVESAAEAKPETPAAEEEADAEDELAAEFSVADDFPSPPDIDKVIAEEKAQKATAPKADAASDEDSLLSDASAKATAAALSQLRKGTGDSSAAAGLNLRNGTTVEDLVVEMLKPMMKQWLDANLPIIVEDVVKREIRKLAD